jgi:hypothetical protein
MPVFSLCNISDISQIFWPGRYIDRAASIL